MKQLEANSYPRPVVGITGEMCCPDGFVATQPAATPAAQALEAGGERMVAMDCEMCITEHVSAGIKGRGVHHRACECGYRGARCVGRGDVCILEHVCA